MTNIAKNREGYGYKYADLAATNAFLLSQGIEYYQTTRTEDDGADYIYTIPVINGRELPARRGCKIVAAPLSGKSNPAQEYGSALTYARRYSLWMAFGLATEDDDAASLTVQREEPPRRQRSRRTEEPAPAPQAAPEAVNSIDQEIERYKETIFARCNDEGIHIDFCARLYGRDSFDELAAKELRFLASDKGWAKVMERHEAETQGA